MFSTGIVFFASFVSFLVFALSGLFDWDLGDFNAIAWGLTFLAGGLFINSREAE